MSGESEIYWAKNSEKFSSNSIHIIGFPFDGTACFRKGAFHGPSAIRSVAYGIESYSPYLDLDLAQYSNIYDLGDLKIESERKGDSSWKTSTDDFLNLTKGLKIKSDQIKIVTLGGEHSISYAPIKKYLEAYPDLVLLHLDAHADLRDGYEGFHYSHASIIRRCLDHFTKDHHLLQYGIRSGTKEEFIEMKEKGFLYSSLESLLQRLDELKERPIYLTLDLDFFDPAYLPGTGTPEAGGENFHNFIKIIKKIKQFHFVGADIVELAPELDQSGNSSVFAVKVLREVVAAMEKVNE